MPKTRSIFTYTAHRSTYLTVVGMFGFLFLIEGGAIALFILLLLQLWWLKLLAMLVLSGLYLYLLIILLSALWTRHQLTTDYLRLRYGWFFQADIPLSTILQAQPVHQRLTAMQPIRAQYVAKQRRIVVCFSEEGQLLLHFQQPLLLKIVGKTHSITSLLLNLDQRDAFLAQLNAVLSLKNVPEEAVLLDEPFLPPKSVSSISTSVELHHLGAPPAIRITDLHRKFANFTAVERLNMSIQPGEIYGFLGSNGAGKTTIIKMLVGLLEPSAGHVWLAGHDVWSEPLVARALSGYVADRSLLYERLTGREFLAFLAQIRGLASSLAEERINYLLGLLELTEQADRLCGSYSFGMKRKLALASALLHQPPILILDEPLNGLDPRSARRLKDLLLELAAQGTTILLSTHDLATAETVCHRVGIFHKGRLLVEGSASELRQLVSAPDLETVFLALTGEQQADEVNV